MDYIVNFRDHESGKRTAGVVDLHTLGIFFSGMSPSERESLHIMQIITEKPEVMPRRLTWDAVGGKLWLYDCWGNFVDSVSYEEG